MDNQNNNNRPKNPNPNQSRSLQPKPKNPANSRPANNKQISTQNKPVQNARISDEFQRERTAVFDKVTTEKIEKNAQNGKQAQNGTYHYTGRSIKSNRQKFVNTNENISVEKNREKKKSGNVIETRSGGGLVTGIVKAVLYIIGVIGISLILAYNIIMITNEVFAFKKDSVVVEVTLPKNADIDSISEILADNGLINYPGIFKLYANLRGKNKDWEFQGGKTFTISSDMAYDEFIGEFRVQADERQVVTITIPEGFTIDQIIDRFVNEYRIGSRSKFEEVINNHKFEKYKFLEPLYEAPKSPDRKYLLEGYLFPDTYDFYTEENEVNIITKFLDNFDRKFDVRSYERLNILGMTLDDLINLASIIQREAKERADFHKVSAVFHNRLNNSAVFPAFESDATKLYDMPEHREVTRTDLDIDSPYNTYTRNGLPPSAICNPGANAINAALEPYVDPEGIEDWTKYYYFVAQPNGENLYAKTYNEHLNNIAIADAQKEE